MSTALPESVMAALTILELNLTGEDMTRGTEIGIGTTVGTPFVLGKLSVIVQGTIHFMFGRLFIPLDLAALGRMFTRLTERHSDRMAELGLEA